MTDFLEISAYDDNVSTYSRESANFQKDSENHVALSPDGQFATSFNTKSRRIKFYQTNNLDEPTLINYTPPPATSFWSLAISNSITIPGTSEPCNLIALSCFYDKDVMSEQDENELQDYVISQETQDDITEKGDYVETTRIPATTFVISISKSSTNSTNSRIQTTVDNIGGVLHFLPTELSNSFTSLIVMNASGISKAKIYHKNNFALPISGLFNKTITADEFYLPSTVAFKILKLYQDVPCNNFLKSCVEKNYFFAEDYKTHRVEMYNLQSYELELIFQKREDITTSSTTGNAIFAISKSENLLAHCRGNKGITIYLMENGLEVTTKFFYNINKILSIIFINDDEKLFIIAEEEIGHHDNGKVKFAPIVIIWDLFTCKSNIRKIKIKNLENIFPTLIASSSGIIISIVEDGRVFSIPYENLKVSVNHLEELQLQDVKDTSGRFEFRHTIFQLNGKSKDAKTEKRSIVVNNKEPWMQIKQYQRVSAYLDEKKTTQLIIGETTVQVWRKKDSSENSKRFLEYIWTNQGNRQIQINSLSIGESEFSLDLRIPSQHSANFLKVNIHWPQKTHTLKDACKALEFLYSRRNEPVGPKSQNKFDSLVLDTEKLVIYIIKKHPNVWRLSEIRFNLMEYLIRGNRAALIQFILFKNTPQNDVTNPDLSRVCRFLHVPRLYDWRNLNKEWNCDLQVAIECSEGGHRKDSVIVAMLLEYYSNNAMQNVGWMFSISKVIPLLTERRLETYIKELFYKPCFGAKEECLDPAFINRKELKKGYNKSVYALNVKPGLIRKKTKKSWWKKVKIGRPKFKRNKDGKPEDLPVTNLRVVPLPDFTVYPEGINDQKAPKWMVPLHLLKIFLKPRSYTVQGDHQRSSFLRFIRQDENDVFYDNPAMEACINFKWESARNHFIRHIMLYLLYALSFALLTGVFTFDRFNSLFCLIFYYLGYYLLSSEIIQLHYDGWKYFTVYHLIDFLACFVPLASFTAFYSIAIIRSGFQNPNNLDLGFERTRTITISFVILLIYFELILLLRFFEKSAHYINMIINILYGVSTFILFMVLVIIGFGHSMHFLLRHPEKLNETPSGQNFEIINTNEPEDSPQYHPYPNLQLSEIYNLNTTSDNYYRKLPHSIIAVYFWMLGRWDQLENWTFWPVTVLSIAASILLVIIMQNMLIAFMSGVFDETKTNVKQAVLKFRADLIAEYETIEKPFGNKRGNPRYIYYVGRSEDQEEWLAKAKRYRKAHKSLLADDVYLHRFEDDDDDYGDDGGDTSLSTKTNESDDRDKIDKLEAKMSAMEENIKELLKLLKGGKSL